jgi:hypothetical protein
MSGHMPLRIGWSTQNLCIDALVNLNIWYRIEFAAHRRGREYTSPAVQTLHWMVYYPSHDTGGVLSLVKKYGS